jgi:hypothetical protein
MGGGVKSASFKGSPPITWAGEIAEDPAMQQKRDFDTGDPVTWADGNPRMMLRVIIQTDDRDPQVADDDGKRALYLEGGKAFAVRDAVRAAGATKLERGGWLSLTYTHDDEARRKNTRFNAPKAFKAEYRPPAPQATADPWGAVGAGGAPATPASVPTTSATGASTDRLVAFLREKGLNGPLPQDPAALLMLARSYDPTFEA